ncbi:hypothetical protein D9M72_401870 [compost metagenome]
MVAEGATHRIGNFADGGAGTRRLDGGGQQVAFACQCDLSKRRKGLLDLDAVAPTLGFLDPADLRGAHGAVVDLQNVDRLLVVEAVLVDPNDDLLALVDGGLATGRRLFDQSLRQPGIDRTGHAAHRLDLLDQ